MNRTLLLAVAAGLLGCSDSTTPKPGTFVLDTMDGSGPPFVLAVERWANGDSIVTRLVADSIELRPDSLAVRLRRTDAMIYRGGVLTEVVTGTDHRLWMVSRAGDRLLLRDMLSSMYPAPTDTMTMRDARTLVQVRRVGGICPSSVGAPDACPPASEPVTREFVFRRR